MSAEHPEFTQRALALGMPGHLSVRQDVVHTVVSRGWLTKEDIKAMWSLDEPAYALLKEDLSKEKLISPGPRGVGGFEANIRRRYVAGKDQSSTETLFQTAWENDAVDRLVDLLSHDDIEGLLGELLYTVRRMRHVETGINRRGTKQELASALLIQHGMDLFATADIRDLVAKRAKIKSPRRWVPGKSGALRFAAEAGFPTDLGGLPSDETPPDFEFLEGRVDLKALQLFQLEVQRKLVAKLDTKGGRAIVTLPTGAGKTRVAVDSIRDWLSRRWIDNPTGVGNTVLWLAHTEELCEQAYSCFKEVWQASSNVSPLLLFRFWGRYTQDLSEHLDTLLSIEKRPAVLISTPQRIVNLFRGRVANSSELLEGLRKTLGLILVDEAHRAAAPSYRQIIATFRKALDDVRVIGLTATPFRQEYSADDPMAGTRELRELFENIIEPIDTLGEEPRVRLQEQQFLAIPEWTSVKTETLMKAPEVGDLDHLSVEDIEKIDYALKIRADNPKRRLAILGHMLELAKTAEHQIIYFGPSVMDAECMAFMLRERRVSAAFVSGDTRDVTRRKVIGDFKANRVRVLCNCEVLTTGFDAPKVTHVVMARPTVSRVLYEQMVGRGLRGPKFGGTAKCHIVDLEDNYRSDRPTLGYQSFRELWTSEMKAKRRG
jgi:superfamily II DNA or RNA helicase